MQLIGLEKMFGYNMERQDRQKKTPLQKSISLAIQLAIAWIDPTRKSISNAFVQYLINMPMYSH